MDLSIFCGTRMYHVMLSYLYSNFMQVDYQMSVSSAGIEILNDSRTATFYHYHDWYI